MPQLGQGILKGMSITLRNLFKNKITRQYPEYKRDLPDRTRGMLTVDMDRCIACLQCMRVCPDHCISIEQTKRDADGSGKPKPYAVGFVIDDSRCMYCSLCVEVCPVNCIYHTEEFEAQAYNRLELARQFGERPVDPTIDPRPPVKKKPKKAAAKGKADEKADGDAPKKAPAKAAGKSSEGDAA
ncbi:MAG: NADH-quinone oxidoreductase subunit I [Actinomycetota bacterium]|jgi:NADH-quinone oxidoreductase subunit I|nr:NADH-quinone oxidoreductase subunit I [Rubrobacter sp.]MDQ3507440.1 NADH-quinone oxidoreductase subunit I [Actinomycetota bacterium]